MRRGVLAVAYGACALVLSLGRLAAAAPACPGDLDGDRRVAVHELVAAVAAALHGCASRPDVPCPGDGNADRLVTVDEVVEAVDGSLDGCPRGGGGPWWKGNLHTHTLWSDGDQYPEMILDWYRGAGYHFVALSDHNELGAAERWLDVGTSRGGVAAYRAYLDRFGAGWVRSRETGGALQVLLTPLDECRRLLDEPGRFLTLPGEELTTSVPGPGAVPGPVHVNATNLAVAIAPPAGDTAVEVAQRSVDAVRAQRAATGQPMFAHLPHPNFGWAFSAHDLAAVRGNQFIEVYNGHPFAWNAGDATHAPVERLWDEALTERLLRGDPPLYGLAVDDAHDYGAPNPRAANPGRGWVMVRAPRLDAGALIAALERGDFYATTGVTLAGLRAGPRGIALRVRAEPGVRYATRFIGTRRPAAALPAEAIGEVLAEQIGPTASYRLRGDELYVRAVVTSSAVRAVTGEPERAWVQPVSPRR